MKTSRVGIELIKKFEGCRLTAYQDIVGVWTIGYGHTAAAGLPVPKKGSTIRQVDADAILISDLGKYEAAVMRATFKSRLLNQNQFDAMVSLCYNVGPGAFAKSSVVRQFNLGNMAKAANAFLLWNKAGGRTVKGLTIRRSAEMALFLAPTAATPTQCVPQLAPAYSGPVAVSGGPGAYPGKMSTPAPMAVSSPLGAIPAQSKDTTMSGEMVWGVIRTVLAAGTGYVVAMGWFDAATYTTIIGAVGTIFVAVWSVMSKK